MSDELKNVLDGQVGKFWPFDTRFNRDHELHGHVRMLANGTVQLEALDERDHSALHGRPKHKIPDFAAGSTSTSGIVLAQRSGESSKRVIAGSHTSVLKYRYRTMFAGVDLYSLRSANVSKIRAHFPNMLRWAGIDAIDYDQETDHENKVTEVTIKLASSEDANSFAAGNGLRITLENDWSVHGPDEHKTILTGLGVVVESRRPRPVSDLLSPLVDVQLLLSTAHDGWAPCRSARARLDCTESVRNRNYCPMWDRDLMRIPPGYNDIDLPLFYYSDLNRETGLRRWLRLNNLHGRFIRPATMRPLFAGMTDTTKLMELYAAIEYYVAASKREKRSWAPRGKIRPAVALVDHASKYFKDFVGDPKLWANTLHDLYNQIKHEATETDPTKVHWFAESARALIISVSLDYATNRTSASERYLSDHRVEYLGSQLETVM